MRTLEQNYERLTLANWQISRAMEQAEQEKGIRPPSSAANVSSESDMREQMRCHVCVAGGAGNVFAAEKNGGFVFENLTDCLNRLRYSTIN